MNKHTFHFAVIFLMLAACASAQGVSAGVSIASGRNSFFLAIGDYYRVPETRVVYIRDHYHCPEEELPVVFFLASRAHVDPAAIIDFRLGRRMSWLNIAFHYGLSPEIFYVPVTRVGPPYGNAYGHYKKHKNNYKKVVLLDDDVVNLVNLRFISEYHRIPPEQVMDRRGRGEKFAVIDSHFREEKLRRGNDRKDRNDRYEQERFTGRDRNDRIGNGREQQEKETGKKDKGNGRGKNKNQ